MLLFWTVFAVETLMRRRLSRLVRARVGRGDPVMVEGADNLPSTGSFVLALNHYGGAPVFDLIAWTLIAAEEARPDTADRWLIIVGQRKRLRRSRTAKLIAWIVDAVFRRWSDHTVRIQLGNSALSIQALRDWRRRAREQPVLVFPEGKAALEFGAVRPGAGRWLAALEVPIIPAGAWWSDGEPRVRIGTPIRWSHRPELRDAQLGLAIAHLLPPDLAPRWQHALRRWRKSERVKDEGRRTEDGGRRTEDEGPRTEDEGRRTEDRGWGTKDEGDGSRWTG